MKPANFCEVWNHLQSVFIANLVTNGQFTVCAERETSTNISISSPSVHCCCRNKAGRAVNASQVLLRWGHLGQTPLGGHHRHRARPSIRPGRHHSDVCRLFNPPGPRRAVAAPAEPGRLQAPLRGFDAMPASCRPVRGGRHGRRSGSARRAAARPGTARGQRFPCSIAGSARLGCVGWGQYGKPSPAD